MSERLTQAQAEIDYRLDRAKVMALGKEMLNEGPALYSHELVYEDNIAQNLAKVRAERSVAVEAAGSIDELMDDIRDFLGKDESRWTTRGKVLAGLAAVVATGTLMMSNGGPGQVYENIKTFPAHVGYIFNGYVSNSHSNDAPNSTLGG